MLMSAWIFLSALVAAAAFRLAEVWYYRKWYRQGILWDAALHLAVIRTLQRKGAYNGVDEFLMCDEADGYPIAFHRFAALFPEKILQRYPFLPGVVIYAVSFALFAAYLDYIGDNYFGGAGLSLCVAGCLLLMFSVSNIVLNDNAILYISLSERQLARLATGWYYLALLFAMAFDDGLSWAFAVVAGAVCAISAMFARQAVAFGSIVLALILWSPAPLATLAASVLGALAIDRGYFIRGLRQMVTFSQAYCRYSKHSKWVKPALSRLVNLNLFKPGAATFATRLRELEIKEPTRLLVYHGELVMCIALFASPASSLEVVALGIVAATLAIYIATSTPILNHFGEAVRYVEYNLCLVVPAILAAAVISDTARLSPYAWAAYFLWFALILLRKHAAWQAFPVQKRDELAEFLRPLGLGHAHTVFPVPFTLGGSICVRADGVRALMCQGAAISPKLYERFCEEPPLLKKNWWALFAEFNITHVISLAGVVNNQRAYVDWEYDFSPLRKVAENADFIAFEVPPRAEWPEARSSDR